MPGTVLHAMRDFGLLRMYRQCTLSPMQSDLFQEIYSLCICPAVDDDVVNIALEAVPLVA